MYHQSSAIGLDSTSGKFRCTSSLTIEHFFIVLLIRLPTDSAHVRTRLCLDYFAFSLEEDRAYSLIKYMSLEGTGLYASRRRTSNARFHPLNRCSLLALFSACSFTKCLRLGSAGSGIFVFLPNLSRYLSVELLFESLNLMEVMLA